MMFMKRLIPTVLLVLFCCTTAMAGYSDQRFINNKAVKEALAKCWEKQGICCEKTAEDDESKEELWGCFVSQRIYLKISTDYDRAIWGAEVDSTGESVKRINVFIPHTDEKGVYCGKSMLGITPKEKTSVSECVKLLCYDNTFDEDKFEVDFATYGGYISPQLPRYFSKYEKLTESTPDEINSIDDGLYYSGLLYLEIKPGEKVMVQIAYADEDLIDKL